jgi:hypothetical protein
VRQRRRATEHARDRIVEETEPGEPPDRREQESEHDADVVLVGADQIVLADRDLAADVRAEEEAADAERDRGEEIEAEEAAGGVSRDDRMRSRSVDQPALRSGSGK